ncbi:MAG: hypothetical protein ACFFC1_03675 [Promethearchaeota archaeon]
MATKTLSDLPVASTPANADITHIRQSSTDKSLTLNLLSEFVLRTSDWADKVSTLTSDTDFTSAQMEPDRRIFVNPTAGNITVGLFNGSDRDGSIAIINVVGTGNVVNVELASAGVTSYVLVSGDSLMIMWDDTNSVWRVLLLEQPNLFNQVISTQSEFNTLIERVAANQYKIKDGVTSMYVKTLSGGYQMTGGTSPLSGGDTWGYVETNQCTKLTFESGAFIDMHQERGYIKVNTDKCFLKNVSVQGDKGVASAIARSFLLAANYVTYSNCNSQTRLSNTSFSVFEGSATAIHNQNSKYIGCSVTDCDSSSEVIIFKNCENIDDAYIYDIETTGAGATSYVFNGCKNVNNIRVQKIDSSTDELWIFNTCENVNNVECDDIDHTGATCLYFCESCENMVNIVLDDMESSTDIILNYSSNNLSNFNITNIVSTGGTLSGYDSCNRLTNCYNNTLDSTSHCYGFSNCTFLENCEIIDLDNTVSGNSVGFYLCTNLNLCKAIDIDVVVGLNYFGFSNCSELSGCTANDCYNGFNNCNQLTSCYSTLNTFNGFEGCSRLSSCEAVSNTNHGFSNGFYLTSCYGDSNGVDGFNDCDGCQSCAAVSNTGD